MYILFYHKFALKFILLKFIIILMVKIKAIIKFKAIITINQDLHFFLSF